MRDINVTKLRKILMDIQSTCSDEKLRANEIEYRTSGKKTNLTDYERGRIAGMHRAYNSILKKLAVMINFADYEWKNAHCRDEEYTTINIPTITNQSGPKFKVGQTVCAVKVVFDIDNPKVHVKCDVCDSTGKIKIVGKDGEYTCPVCHGEVKENENPYKYAIAYPHATIGRVTHEEYSYKYRIKGKKFHTKTEYLLEETGVECGGQIWFEHNLFSTLEEAQDFCKKYIPSSKFNSCEPILKTDAGLL